VKTNAAQHGSRSDQPYRQPAASARFAGVVGRERVIAGTDCGFGTSGAGDEVHPDVAWAKLGALVEGARLASQRLYGR
jgi:methionine synthase II (cobalamin-independent)